MERPNDQPQLLQTVTTEAEACILSARLADAGIDAWVEGGISAGFRAEAPGSARVLVRQRDLERAVEILRSERG